MLSFLRRLLTPTAGREVAASPLPVSPSTIRQSFEAASNDEEHFPSSIDERIYHVKLVVAHMAPARAGRILDLGSGKGRFTRIVQQRYPESQPVALDLAHSMLIHAAPLPRVCASMLELPFANQTFQGLYAIESLEHAVDIDKAVDEICRVVTPGGRILIIDKNAEHWGKLKTPEWERWFHRSELESKLRRHCRTVSSKPISYWEDVEPDGLFLAWMAEK